MPPSALRCVIYLVSLCFIPDPDLNPLVCFEEFQVVLFLLVDVGFVKMCIDACGGTVLC